MFRVDAPRHSLHQSIVCGAFSILCVCTAIAIAEPYIPQDDQQVLQRLAMSRAGPDDSLGQLRKQVRQNPDNMALALLLAERYISIGNTLSDPRYYGYAQAVLQPWWQQPQPPAHILLLRAKLRQKQHDFRTALADLEQLLARESRNPQAWLEQSVLQRVQGDYRAARNSCLPLQRLTRGIVSQVCIANADSLSGRARQSYLLLQQVLQQHPNADPGMQLWAWTLMAEISIQLGEDIQAEQNIQQGLALAAEDSYLLAVYADFLLEHQRPQEVITLLSGQESNDTLLLLLSIAEKRLQHPDGQAHQALLTARIDAAQLRGGYAHLRTAARFTLDLLEQPGPALKLAQANWANQREPADARLLLRAALAAATPDASRPVRNWLTETGLEDRSCQALLDRIAAL